MSKILYCSFCGRSENEVELLIAGAEVFICGECIDSCTEIREGFSKTKKATANFPCGSLGEEVCE